MYHVHWHPANPAYKNRCGILHTQGFPLQSRLKLLMHPQKKPGQPGRAGRLKKMNTPGVPWFMPWRFKVSEVVLQMQCFWDFLVEVFCFYLSDDSQEVLLRCCSVVLFFASTFERGYVTSREGCLVLLVGGSFPQVRLDKSKKSLKTTLQRHFWVDDFPNFPGWDMDSFPGGNIWTHPTNPSGSPRWVHRPTGTLKGRFFFRSFLGKGHT